MGKYVDSEKLIAEIERRKELLFLCDNDYQMAIDGWKERAYNEVLSLVTNLQQEQSSPCWIHANYSDKPEVRYTPSGVPYLQNGAHMIWLSDLETLPKDCIVKID